MTRNGSRNLTLLVVTAALVCFMALASSAFAVPGDTVGNATSLNDYLGSTLTTGLVNTGIVPTGHYYFRVELNAGDTLGATFTPGAGVVNMKALVLALSSSYRIVESSADASGVARLSFLAPVHGMYTIYLGTSSLGTFSVTPAKTGAKSFSLATMTVPTAHANKSFTPSTKLSPAYNGPASPVKFYVQRKVNGHWPKSSSTHYTTKIGTFSAAQTYSKFSASLKLPKGTFRIRAGFRDAAHKTEKFNGYKTITVK